MKTFNFFVIFIVFLLIAVVTKLWIASNTNQAVDFKPVYLSNVSLDVEFSNSGQEIFVLLPVDMNKIDTLKIMTRPALIVGPANLTDLLKELNISSEVVPLTPLPRATFLYDGKLVVLERGELGRYLTWIQNVITDKINWSIGIYSDSSGVLIGAEYFHIETPKNLSTVGGQLYKDRVVVNIVVPRNERIDFSLAPLSGKLLDYSPTTTKDQTVIVRDRSSFSRNVAGWIVENHGAGYVQLRAIFGIDMNSSIFQYSLNGVKGLLSFHVKDSS